ncbi:7610_t:CDS:2, partial [Gigaspora rosea]
RPNGSVLTLLCGTDISVAIESVIDAHDVPLCRVKGGGRRLVFGEFKE